MLAKLVSKWFNKIIYTAVNMKIIFENIVKISSPPINVSGYKVSHVASYMYLHIQLYNLIMSMFTCVTMLIESIW